MKLMYAGVELRQVENCDVLEKEIGVGISIHT